MRGGYRNVGKPGRGILQIHQENLKPAQQESTAIRSLFYNPETLEMQIEFNQRGTYAYFNVPPDEFESFNLAGSRGTYFNLYIRDKYSYERVA